MSTPEMEHYRLPETTPFENHGRTAAGWTFAVGICIGVLVAGIGLIVSPIMIWAGVAISVITIAVSFGLHLTGRGQPSSLTMTAKGGDWYQD